MKRRKMHFYYRFPGAFYPHDEYAATEREAREKIRKAWGLKRLPRGFEIWRSDYVGTWDPEFEFPGYVRHP